MLSFIEIAIDLLFGRYCMWQHCAKTMQKKIFFHYHFTIASNINCYYHLSTRIFSKEWSDDAFCLKSAPNSDTLWTRLFLSHHSQIFWTPNAQMVRSYARPYWKLETWIRDHGIISSDPLPTRLLVGGMMCYIYFE